MIYLSVGGADSERQLEILKVHRVAATDQFVEKRLHADFTRLQARRGASEEIFETSPEMSLSLVKRGVYRSSCLSKPPLNATTTLCAESSVARPRLAAIAYSLFTRIATAPLASRRL